MLAVFLGLGHRQGQWPAHDVAIIGDGIIKCNGRACRNPERHLILHRFWTGCCRWKLPELALMRHVTLPELAHKRQHFLHVAIAVLLIEARLHSVKFALIGTRAKTKFQTSTRNQIDHRRLTRDVDWMPVGSICDTGAKTDGLGVVSPPGEQLKRIWCNRHFQGMMFSRPGDFKARAISHLHHFQRVLSHRHHVGGIIHPLQIDRKMEFHDLSPFAVSAVRIGLPKVCWMYSSIPSLAACSHRSPESRFRAHSRMSWCRQIPLSERLHGRYSPR